jgi:hypothetical protein
MFENEDELSEALALLVKHGLLDIAMREDGEWLYGLSKEALEMSEEDKMDAIFQMLENEEEEDELS